MNRWNFFNLENNKIIKDEEMTLNELAITFGSNIGIKMNRQF